MRKGCEKNIEKYMWIELNTTQQDRTHTRHVKTHTNTMTTIHFGDLFHRFFICTITMNPMITNI